MADEKLTPEPDIYDREDQCRKAIRTVGKAVFMRLLVTALLVFVLIGNGMQGWVIGLIVFVLIINLTGMLPLVQELRKQRKRPNRYDEVGLFSGLLFCADCGSVLYQQRYENKTRKQDCYICGNYKKRTHDCTAHFIRTDLLTAGVTANLKKITAYAAKHEKQFMKLLVQQNEDGGKRRSAAKKRELEAAEKRIGELSAIFKRLYEDSVAGRISDERFAELSADYEAEQLELKERAAAIQAELSKAQEATVNAGKFMNIVRRHISFEELTPTLLREFIEKIVVHECSYDENKHRRQEIEIYYSFVGKVDLPD